MKHGTCKGCAADIVWAKTTKGNWCPYDPEPVEHGVRFVLSNDDPQIAFATVVGNGYVSHFKTCPMANDFREEIDAQEGFDFD